MIDPIVRRSVNFSFKNPRSRERDQDHAHTLEGKEVAQIKPLQQADVDKKIDREGSNGGGEDKGRVNPGVTLPRRDVHGVLEQNLPSDEATDGDENEKGGKEIQSRSSSLAAGFATIITR